MRVQYRQIIREADHCGDWRLRRRGRDVSLEDKTYVIRQYPVIPLSWDRLADQSSEASLTTPERRGGNAH